MKEIVTTSAFRKDVKRMRRRGKDLSKLEAIVERLATGVELEARHVAHPLTGNWKPSWDLHIEPNWLLVYQVTEEAVMLARTGTHADLFG